MPTDVEPILEDLIARVGKVRRWLLALGVLKIAALWLGCLSVYVGLYALIDHRAHFQWRGRLAALVLLATMLIVLCRYLVRTLRRDMTYSHAANHVESRQSFDQQLVAVVEFYEGKSDYPYSKALARQLVLQVDRATDGFSLDSTIDKWRGYALAACVALCLLVVGLFIGRNVHYFTSYLTRLVRPFSNVEPVSSTTLESLTGDTVTGPNVPVTLSAALSGDLPESAELVLTRPGVEEPNGTSAPRVERIPIEPMPDGQERFTLTAAPSFHTLEDVAYHFEAGDRRTESHTITVAEPPAIERITATVTRPSANGTDSGQTYTEEITDGRLDVLPDSRVQLQVQTNTPLQKVSATGPDGQPMKSNAQASDTFDMAFTAEQDSTMEFSLVSDKGLSNTNPQKLQVSLKSDEPPQFELLSPDGDYLATDIASIPIAFKVTDDFGLTSARLRCEFPDGTSIVLDTEDPAGARETQLAHTLELEQYSLKIGDSLLFYAQAADIDTGQPRSDANSAGEIYFIEIRPYQQYWHPQPGGGPPSQAPGPSPEDLITILEYTRAIVKRTWAVAQEPRLTQAGRDTLDAVAQDLAYCASRLAANRDDPNNAFTESAKAELTEIIALDEEGKNHLARHDISAALGPEREAYRRLRKFIDELHMKWNPPSSGQSAPEDKPERVTLQEKPEDPEMEAERLESQLEEIQQEIEKLTQEQESLKADLADTLDDQAEEAGKASAQGPKGQGQQADASSSQSSQSSSGQGQSTGESSDSDAASQDSGGQGQQGDPSEGSDATSQGTGGQGQPGDQSQESEAASQGAGGQGQPESQSQSSDAASEGSSGQGQSSAQSSESHASSQGSPGQGPSGGQPQGSDAGSQGSGEQGQPGGQSQSSNANSQGSGNQGQSPGQSGESTTNSQGPGGQGQGPDGRSSEGSQGSPDSHSAQTEARLRMLEAKQKTLSEQASQVAAELRQLPPSQEPGQADVRRQAQENLDRAIENMREFEDKLTDIRYEPTASPGREMDMTRLADSAIRELNRASQTLKGGLASGAENGTGDKAQAMAERLAKDAEALDESLDPAQQEEMLKRLEEAQKMLERMTGAQWATISGGGAPGASHVYTRSKPTGPAEAARLLSRQFWSIAVQARERQVGPVQDEPSDVEFFELENEFFENAARYRPESKQR